MADFSIEKDLSNRYSLIAGVDEAGRGALAGPVVAAAVIFNDYEDEELFQINDSKKLSEKKRELFVNIITKKASSYSVSFVDNQTIDKINILNATMLAMRNSIESLLIDPDISLIDGNRFSYNDISHLTVIQGDAKSISIAAASILAKVSRDRYMIDKSLNYPKFRFDKNKGYGTYEHRSYIVKYGVTGIHRRTFLNNITKGINNDKTYTIF